MTETHHKDKGDLARGLPDPLLVQDVAGEMLVDKKGEPIKAHTPPVIVYS